MAEKTIVLLRKFLSRLRFIISWIRVLIFCCSWLPLEIFLWNFILNTSIMPSKMDVRWSFNASTSSVTRKVSGRVFYLKYKFLFATLDFGRWQLICCRLRSFLCVAFWLLWPCRSSVHQVLRNLTIFGWRGKAVSNWTLNLLIINNVSRRLDIKKKSFSWFFIMQFFVVWCYCWQLSLCINAQLIKCSG